MLFSEKFGIIKNRIKEYGAVDISLVCDIPLFIDPMLIFNSEKVEYKKLHKDIIKYFHFLAKKSEKNLSFAEIKLWYTFNEIPNNWFGYSLSGNKGNACDVEFGKFLYNNIKFILNTNGISESEHIEKIMLIYDGSGRDKISDIMVNLIKDYLCDYTEKFAKKYMKKTDCDTFLIDKAEFNYTTESFYTKEYYLPYIINKKGKREFILLTPIDILRKGEPSINREDLINNNKKVREYIDNDILKAEVNNYISKAVAKYEKEQIEQNKRINEGSIRKVESKAFSEIINIHPEIYDYYIRMQEENKEEIKEICSEEVELQLKKYVQNAQKLVELFRRENYEKNEAISAFEESRNRIRYFKHIIEDCDGYKNLYFDGKQISIENDLQRMFKLVWYNTSYKADFETNNGRGPADMVISKGSENQNVIEFKLASNSQLNHVFKQTEIYKKANCSEQSIIVIFYFSEKELIKVNKMLNDNNANNRVDKDIFLIDCRNDNKKSASKA